LALFTRGVGSNVILGDLTRPDERAKRKQVAQGDKTSEHEKEKKGGAGVKYRLVKKGGKPGESMG